VTRTTIIGVIGALAILLALGLNLYTNPEPGGEPQPQAVTEAPSGSTDGPASETVARSDAESVERTPAAPAADTAPAAQASGPEAAPAGKAESSMESQAATAATSKNRRTKAESATGTKSETATEAQPGTGATQLARRSTPEAPVPRAVPKFDIVRIQPNGDTVIAGRAAPGAEVTILDKGKALGSVIADSRGEWVFLPVQPLPPGSRELTLEAKNPNGEQQVSENVVVLVVPEHGRDIAGNPTESGSEALALLVPREGKGVKVLQKPSVPGGVEAPDGDLALDSVDYDDSGEVALSGRASPDSDVLVYLDNDPIGVVRSDSDGNWRLQPEKPVEPGVYKLRVDQSVEGTVTARLELPFARAQPLTDFTSEAFVVVQPGNSLWRIARRTYGTGMRYLVIYGANEEQIRNPDLIYPGQVFVIPTTN